MSKDYSLEKSLDDLQQYEGGEKDIKTTTPGGPRNPATVKQLYTDNNAENDEVAVREALTRTGTLRN